MCTLLPAGLAALLRAVGALGQAAEPGRAEFEAGVAAYRAGAVAGARASFERARAAGYGTPQLRFNLGLCYYRLQRYPEARAEFESLRGAPGFAAAADFHLGLIAAREGDRARAEGLWRALQDGPDAALARRAGVALGRLDHGRAEPIRSGYLLVAAGYDTNPALLDESLQPADGGESAAVDVLGAFNWPLSGSARAFTALRGGAYLRDYAADVGQDQHGAFAGLSRELDDGARRLSWGLDWSTSTFDGEPLLDVTTLAVQRTPSRGSGWRAGVQSSQVTAPPAYAHLEGWRARASLGRAMRTGSALTRLGYEFEYNDREDFALGADFASHSPLRHRVELVVDHRLGARTTLRWSLRHRDSRYRDPDTSGGGLVAERRTEQLSQAGVLLRRRLGRATFALAEVQYSRNAATPARFEYDRATALLGLEWTPSAK
jgi:tetratricopeptide (TPR) repeat protein